MVDFKKALESLNVAQIDADFKAKYGLDLAEPSSLDYLKLLADAGEAGLTEEWIIEQLEPNNAYAIRQEDGSVLMFGFTWQLFRQLWDLIRAHKHAIKEQVPLPPVLDEQMLKAEKHKLAQWAEEQGLSEGEILECWSNAFWSEKTMIASVTPKRLEVFRSEILKKIKEKQDESGSNNGDSTRGGGNVNELDSSGDALEEQGGSEEDREAGSGAGEPEQQCGPTVLHESSEPASTDTSEQVQVGQKFPLECVAPESLNELCNTQLKFTEFLSGLSELDWNEIDQYYHQVLNGEEFTVEGFDKYLLGCWQTKTPFYPGYKFPDAPAMMPEKINEETGEVKVDGLLLSLGLTEFPTLDHPEIDRIIEEVGRRIALDKAEVEIRRKNCEAKCEQLLKHAAGYELAFGELISQHAAKQLKRSKKTGKIYGAKTVVYDTFCVSFEKSGGIWVGDKKKLDAHFVSDEKARKTYGVTLETVPKYENKHVLDIISERGKQRLELQEQISNLTIMLEKSGDPEIGEKLKELEEALKNVPPLTLPGVTDAPVNEIAKWEIKPTKESKKQ